MDSAPDETAVGAGANVAMPARRFQKQFQSISVCSSKKVARFPLTTCWNFCASHLKIAVMNLFSCVALLRQIFRRLQKVGEDSQNKACLCYGKRGNPTERPSHKKLRILAAQQPRQAASSSLTVIC